MRILTHELISYTLMDILHIMNPSLDRSEGTYPWNYDTNKMIDALAADHVGFNPTDSEKVYIKILMNEYILPSCWNMKVEVSDAEDDKGYVFLGEFIHFLNGTKDKYCVLLDAYTQNKSKLMEYAKNIVETTSTSNDTPQDEGNNWGDDQHVSAIGKSSTESTSSGGNLILDQLSMINSRYKNIYELWNKEFIKQFRVGGI